MSLPFAKLSNGWKAQTNDNEEESEKDGVNVLHSGDKRRWDQCTCRRCMAYRYQRGIRQLERILGRRPTQQEVAAEWNRIQREAGVL